MADIKWTDIVIALVAIYAAGLSTYTFIQDKRDKRPLLKVRLTYGILDYVTRGEIAMLFSMSNPGSRPVTVTSVCLLLPDKRTMVVRQLQGTAPLPVELQPGQGQTYWMLPRDVAQTLQKEGYRGVLNVRATCTDATGRDYHSKAGTFDIEARLKDD